MNDPTIPTHWPLDWPDSYRELGPGDVIQEGDLYWSTSGKWEECVFVGAEIRSGCTTAFLRPKRN